MTAPKTAPIQESTGWNPTEGDVLAGTIVAITRGWSDWTQSHYPLLTIRDEAGKLTDLHCFHATLRDRLMEVRPKIGSEIEVAFLGKQSTKDNKRTVAIYKVTIPGETGEEVWGQLAGEAPRNARAAAQGTIPGVPADDADDVPF